MKKNNFSLSERIANRLIINSPGVSATGLANGNAGDAICLYALYRKTDCKIYEEVADHLIHLIYKKSNMGTVTGFSYGLAGTGACIEYLAQNNFVDADTSEALEDIDEVIFQLDRKKYRQTEIFSDFYGPGLYYLMRTKKELPQWNEDAIRFLEYDIMKMLSSKKDENIDNIELIQQNEPNENSKISNQYLVSLCGFIYMTKHLFPTELTQKVFAFTMEHLKPENLSITEKMLLCNCIETIEVPFDITDEIETFNETGLFKACSDYAFYSLMFQEIIEKLHLPLQNRLNAVMETDTGQKYLFDRDSGLTGISAMYPFVSFVKPEKTIQLTAGKNKSLYIFNETSRAAIYGIGTYINELTQCLKDTDININVVTLNSDKVSEFCIENNDGVKEWKIPAGKYHDTDYYQNIIPILKLYIPDTKNIVFHFNYWQNLSMTDNLKNIFNCKTVLAIHYMNWCFGLNGNLLHLKTILSKDEKDLDENEKNIRNSFNHEKQSVENADAVISLANYTSGVLCSEYGVNSDKITTIYNGLQDALKPTMSKKTIRLKAKYHIAQNEKLILFAGRLDPVKGMDKLIGAFRKVLKQKPDCRLIIAGEGNFSVYFAKARDIWAKIIFTGRIEQSKLFEFYRIADIGVMPSTHEQCSYTAIEMMMHGLPLIASTTTGLSEMVEDKVSGLKVPVREYKNKVTVSENLLAEHILYLLNSPKILSEMKKQSRRRFLNRYTAEIMRKNMTEFYNMIFAQMES
ncbi:MAG: TIGR04157 family glycosyltransferase [Prevotellaceae bacterium]|jgi:glycosyltransferase|nr:TIGR04157 family glycosyltransferase [Prevotellaceae bacterium]